MLEVKADGLEASFEALEQDEDGVAALKEELALLKKRIDGGRDRGAAAGARWGQVGGSERFVEQYLRKGSRAGWR